MQAESLAKQNANEVIGRTVSRYLEKNRFSYSDFAAVLYDENGRAVSVEAIPYNINKVQSELSAEINRAFADEQEKDTRIAVGSLTDSPLLNGKGPHVKIRLCPAENAEVRLKSSFDSAGVNQTRHRITAVITAELSSSVPTYRFKSTASFEFLLAETVIVGNVPDISRYAWNELS